MKGFSLKDFFNNLSISNKFAAVFIFLLFLMGIGSAVALYNAGQIARVTRILYQNSFRRVENLTAVENELNSSRQEILLHAVTLDRPTKKFLNISLVERKKRIERLLEEYRRMGLTESQRPLFKTLLTNFAGFWHIHGKAVDLSNRDRRDEALNIIQTGGNKIFISTLDSLKDLIQMERAGARSAFEKSAFFASVIKIVTLALSISAIILALGLWMALKRAIVRPILALEESARRIAGGDFSATVPAFGSDEIGILAEEFNRMSDSLKQYYSNLEKKVQERTKELKKANEELFRKKQELELANFELQGANRMKSQFLSNVSHELRTPLNSIIGFSELLTERAFGDLNEKQAQYVEFIHSSGGHLLKLINNILELSKIEAGRMKVEKEVFPVTEAIGEVMGIIRPIAHDRNVTVEIKTVPASPKLRADKAKFKQIMLNLLSNAVKFNVKGGKVDVDWEIVEEPDGMEMERYIVFSIKDTGIGIREEDGDRLFKEFEQLDSSFTREYEGTGLGLALTKKLVELHGGKVWFESAQGSGSTFYVKLPQGTEELDLPVDADFEFLPVAGTRRPLIIIAGESPDINHLLEIYLSGDVYEIVTASDGLDLLKKVREESPFAVIMGTALPKKDGWEVLKELKADPATTHIPVIIISSADSRELGYSMGAVEYMGKPVDRKRLLSVLERLRRQPARTISRVLLVDDAIDELEEAVEFLEKEGLLVFMAEGDKRGVALAASCRPDCIVMRITGKNKKRFFKVMEELNKFAASAGIPLIAVAAEDLSDRDRGVLNGMNVRIVEARGDSVSEKIVEEIRGLEPL